MAALREIRAVWGLNAAVKRDTGDDSAGLTYSGLAERLKANAAEHDANDDREETTPEATPADAG